MTTRPPTRDEIQTAAMVLAKIAAADQWGAKPDAAMAAAWAECFAVHDLQRPDLLEAATRLYADTSRDRSNRTLPADIIGWARKLRQERQEREKAGQTVEQSALSRARNAVHDCALCDPNGWIETAGGQLVKCRHDQQIAG